MVDSTGSGPVEAGARGQGRKGLRPARPGVRGVADLSRRCPGFVTGGTRIRHRCHVFVTAPLLSLLLWRETCPMRHLGSTAVGTWGGPGRRTVTEVRTSVTSLCPLSHEPLRTDLGRVPRPEARPSHRGINRLVGREAFGLDQRLDFAGPPAPASGGGRGRSGS